MKNILTLTFFNAVMKERDKRLTERFTAQNEAIKKAEKALSDVLTGFPQEYSKVIALEELRKLIEELRSDHVTRREVETLRSFQSKTLGALALLMVLVPIITGLIVYVLTRHAVPLTPPPQGG